MNKVILNNVVSDIGRVLRLVREKIGKNQAEIARIAGISTSMLSQIERGAVSPSIETLVVVCEALDLQVADLFRYVAPAPAVRIHHPDSRLRLRNGGLYYEQLVDVTAGGTPSELLLLDLAPQSRTSMSDRGHEGVEMGYVLEGEGILTIEGSDHGIAAGDSLFFNAHLPHCLYNPGSRNLKAVWFISPPHMDYLGNGEVTDSQ